tara:strand:+ start:6278 stop:6862 length:585 start_codon:yes stop_codon:yes gene_type:complete
MTIELLQHDIFGYKARTIENAKKADHTILFCANKASSGSKLTKQFSSRYTMIDVDMDAINKPNYMNHVRLKAAMKIVREIRDIESPKLNIAGNTMFTFYLHHIRQEDVNQFIYDVLRIVMTYVPIEEIRSGGQTGADVAGLVAAYKLGIPAIGLYPAEYMIRTFEGEDVYSSADEQMWYIENWAEELENNVIIW